MAESDIKKYEYLGSRDVVSPVGVVFPLIVPKQEKPLFRGGRKVFASQAKSGHKDDVGDALLNAQRLADWLGDEVLVVFGKGTGTMFSDSDRIETITPAHISNARRRALGKFFAYTDAIINMGSLMLSGYPMDVAKTLKTAMLKLSEERTKLVEESCI